MWICPICGSKTIGKISRGRYFCGECCHEWTLEEGGLAIYQIDVDGTAVRLRNRFKNRMGASNGSGALSSSPVEARYSKRNVS